MLLVLFFFFKDDFSFFNSCLSPSVFTVLLGAKYYLVS